MNSGQLTSNIVKLATRGMYGEAISAEDLKEGFSALESSIACDRHAAMALLLRSRAPELPLAAAIDRLERECKRNPPNDEEFWLNWAISFLPDEVLTSNRAIRLFTYRTAFSDEVACQTNATTTLERLARLGDAVARSILEICASSDELKVRTNAQSSLRNLAK